MKHLFFLLCFCTFQIISCKKVIPPFNKQEIKKKVDSILLLRTKELDEKAQLDLELRIKIEVKVKADSIISAKQQLKHRDTVSHK